MQQLSSNNSAKQRSAVNHVPLAGAVEAALRVASARGERVFVIGGIVRDLLMGGTIGDYDLDIVVEGDGLAFARALKEELGCSLREHQSFMTAKLTAPFVEVEGEGVFLTEIDIATARVEQYAKPGALPTVRPAQIEQDLWRRDFSTNAIALPLELFAQYRANTLSLAQLSERIVDPCAGLKDLQNGTLRVLHPRSFIDDPTRLFRAVRYAVRLSFHFDMETLAAFVDAVNGGALATLSPRRVWNEVVTAFDEELASEVIQEFADRGLFSYLPILSAEQAHDAVAALKRTEEMRAVLSNEVYALANKLVLIVALVRDGRDDIVLAIHEGSTMLQRARGVLAAAAGGEEPTGAADLVAAYALSGSAELQMALQAALQSGGE